MTIELSQRSVELDMATAGWQIKLTQSSIRDATSMKGLAFMGALFLPGAFISSFFGMPFFEFEIGKPSIHLPFMPLVEKPDRNTQASSGFISS